MLYTEHRDLNLLRYGNKPGELLTYLTKEAIAPITFSKIRKPEGSFSSNPAEINAIFGKFYETLYSAQSENKAAADRLLGATSLPTLTKEQLDNSNGPIQIIQIKMVISGLSKRKAPGPDGYSS